MAIRKIVKRGNAALEKQCRPVDAFNKRLEILLGDLADTMYDAGGVGLAAPQVGILRRAVVVDTGEEFLELVNPEVIETSGEQDGIEGCLSVPGVYGFVKRPNVVTVRAQDRDGQWFEATGEELIARCFCHECDHLDGHLYREKVYRYPTQEELEELFGDRETEA